MADWRIRRQHTGRGAAWPLALACLAAACGDGPLPDPVDPPAPPTPGIVDVFLATPHEADRAFSVFVSTAIADFTAAAGVQHFLNAGTASTQLLIVAAQALAQGETHLGSFAIADVRRIPELFAIVTEVAGADYQLRPDLTTYAVRLARR